MTITDVIMGGYPPIFNLRIYFSTMMYGSLYLVSVQSMHPTKGADLMPIQSDFIFSLLKKWQKEKIQVSYEYVVNSITDEVTVTFSLASPDVLDNTEYQLICKAIKQ